MNHDHPNPRTDSLIQRGFKALAGLGFRTQRTAGATTTVDHSLGGAPAGDPLIDLDDPEQRLLGDYELLEVAGQGGMGVVYRARQLSLEREVAVKLLSVGPWARLDFAERFRGEARNAARMQHPNIVAIHEIGQQRDLPYFSMQYVAGASLDRVLRDGGPLSGIEAAKLLRTLAEAVDYAHQLNVLHLDLKPGNVLIESSSGRPVIADFGLARPLDQALAAHGDEVSGTPSFMAPEQVQIREHALSRATDIYGLGAILYQVLTGHPPFVGTDAEEIMQRVVDDAPRKPTAIDRAIPRDLEAICLRCLAKSPEQRYASARDLADDLIRFLDGRPISIRRPTAWERVVRWYKQEPISFGGVATAFVVLGVSVAALGWMFLDRESRIMQRDVTVAALATLLRDPAPMTEAGPRAESFIRALQAADLASNAEAERADLLFALAGEQERHQQPLQAEALRGAAVELRFGSERQRWVDTLEGRGTAIGFLVAAYFRKDDPYRLDGGRKRLVHDLEQAAALGNDDAGLLSAVASVCDSDAIAECHSERIHARIAELLPDDVAAATAFAVRSTEIDAAALARLRVLVARPGAAWNDRRSSVLHAIREELGATAADLDRRFPVDAPSRASTYDLLVLDAFSVLYTDARNLFQVRNRCALQRLSPPGLDRDLCVRLAQLMIAENRAESVRFVGLRLTADNAVLGDDPSAKIVAEKAIGDFAHETHDGFTTCCRVPAEATRFIDSVLRNGEIAALTQRAAQTKEAARDGVEEQR